MDARGIDTNDPGWVNRKFLALERKIEALRSERRAAATTIGEGGELFIRGLLRIAGALDLTGTLSMKSEDDVEMVRMGDMTFGRGFELKRDDGSAALRFRKAFSNSPLQAWSLADRNGQTVVGENTLGGAGLGRPHLEHPFQPYSAATGTAVTCGPYGWERTTSVAAWTTLFVYDGKVQNPYLDLKVAAFCSDATTAGEIRVINLDTGVALPGFLEPAWLGLVPLATTTYLVVDPPNTRIVMPGIASIGSYVRIGIQVQRTAGAGSITLAVPQSIGG
jgi:hypothetical protein